MLLSPLNVRYRFDWLPIVRSRINFYICKADQKKQPEYFCHQSCLFLLHLEPFQTQPSTY